FRAWYSIESNWDYAYAVCSTDGGRTWENLAGTNTTMSDPNGNNADNGITGSANWVQMTFDLAAYVGAPVRLGVRYFTDGGVQNEGIYIDDVWPRQDWTTETV
ncbi:MAG: immune inhibitor A, partial [Gemmatimonadetes bacterium]|nr:immune inhibitor A [Gemmatimonadota bacterium]